MEHNSVITISELHLKMFENLVESEPVAEPMPTQFFINLLRLEEKYYLGDFDLDSLNELVSNYAKCVEFYDIMKDPIKYYFIEKIQGTLASRSSLKILISKSKESGENNHDFSTGRGGIYKSINYSEAMTLSQSRSFEEFKFGEEEEEEELNKEKNRKTLAKIRAGAANPDRTSLRYSISKKKIERAKKITMYMQMEQKRHELKDINSIMADYENQIARNDMVVTQHLNAQNQILQAKIVKRNINYSQNREISSFKKEPPTYAVMRYLSEVDTAREHLEYNSHLISDTNNLNNHSKHEEKSHDEPNADYFKKRASKEESDREGEWMHNRTELSSEGNLEDMIATPKIRKVYEHKLEEEPDGVAEQTASVNPANLTEDKNGNYSDNIE